MASRHVGPLPLAARQQDACLDGSNIKARLHPSTQPRRSASEVSSARASTTTDVGHLYHGLVVLEWEDGVHGLYSRDSPYPAAMCRKVVFHGRSSSNSAAALEPT